MHDTYSATVGGLTTAYCPAKAKHKVTILEAATTIDGLGTGIQLSPNISRLLTRWGLGKNLEDFTVKPETLTFHPSFSKSLDASL